METTGQSTLFDGRRGPLFRLALRTSVLTVLTLGMYRFWMKTRLRRYYWSSVRPGGYPLEYTGEPIEKLLGFLIAVVVLAVYIGVVNLILMFFSFAVLHGNVAAYFLSFVGVIPIWFYALYRARRYVLARTRWRGVRFGVEQGAFGYAWRALLYWGLAILTLGLLWPRKTFLLEKYKIDRTWLGSWALEQGGNWKMLLPGFLPALACIALIAAGIGLDWIENEAFAIPLVIGVLGLPPAMLVYGVTSRRKLASHVTAGALSLTSRARVGRVFGIYALGYGMTLGCISVALGTMALVAASWLGVAGAFGSGLESVVGEVPVPLATVFGVLAYFATFLLWGVFGHVFITLPLWRHYAETLEIGGTEDLSGLRQRGFDGFRDAEGLAEALDLGAAI